MIDHAGKRTGFFLPPRSRDRFARTLVRESGTTPAYRYLERGSYVVAPGPLPLSGDRYQWLAAPRHQPEASPPRTVALAVMLGAAADTIARADRYGERYPSTGTGCAAEVAEPIPEG
ncbi:hypothetical protein GTY54_02105 [Streptomyces sp. SID625]|nr:hypothetical protein [Streptomyces sp. SID625]